MHVCDIDILLRNRMSLVGTDNLSAAGLVKGTTESESPPMNLYSEELQMVLVSHSGGISEGKLTDVCGDDDVVCL